MPSPDSDPLGDWSWYGPPICRWWFFNDFVAEKFAYTNGYEVEQVQASSERTLDKGIPEFIFDYFREEPPD